jgi:chitin disaccharide deacetylase
MGCGFFSQVKGDSVSLFRFSADSEIGLKPGSIHRPSCGFLGSSLRNLCVSLRLCGASWLQLARSKLLVKCLVVALIAALPALTFTGPASATGPLTGDLHRNLQTLAERLGYPKTAKLLIIHADDLGVAHSVDVATTKALETGSVNSGSIMVPCPWFSDIAAYARAHPQVDLGLHLVLTSEWATYRWGPVMTRDKVTSLLAPDGYLYPTEDEAAKHIQSQEAEREIRAQVERALAFGIHPTHLDSHMGTLTQTRELLDAYLRVGRDYRLPLRITREIADRPESAGLINSDDVVIDREITITPNVPASGWADFYRKSIKSLEPGVTEFVIHLAYDDAEMRAITVGHPDWGAAWRQRDFDFFTSSECKNLLQESGVELITWREIGKLLKEPAH